MMKRDPSCLGAEALPVVAVPGPAALPHQRAGGWVHVGQAQGVLITPGIALFSLEPELNGRHLKLSRGDRFPRRAGTGSDYK